MAENEYFAWIAGDTLYPGSRSKWKLQLNKITPGVDQQAKQPRFTVTPDVVHKSEIQITQTFSTAPPPLQKY